MTSRTTRIAVSSATALLCIGAGTPALAHTGTDAHARPSSSTRTHTLQQQKAWALAFADDVSARLAAAAKRVAADPHLSSARRAALLAAIAKAQSVVATFKAQASAATTAAQLHSAMRTAIGEITSAFAGVSPAWAHARHRARPARHSRVAHKDPRTATLATAHPAATTLRHTRSINVDPRRHCQQGDPGARDRHRGDRDRHGRDSGGRGWSGHGRHHGGGDHDGFGQRA